MLGDLFSTLILVFTSLVGVNIISVLEIGELSSGAVGPVDGLLRLVVPIPDHGVLDEKGSDVIGQQLWIGLSNN